eukprot:gene11977-13214_t
MEPSPMGLSFEYLPAVVINKILESLDIETLLSLEKTCHKLLDIVKKYWQVYCKRNKVLEDPSPLCVAWNVNPKSIFSFDNAVQYCENPESRWKVMSIRFALTKDRKCIICKTDLRDMCGLNGLYFEHDLLLCEAHSLITMMASTQSNNQTIGITDDDVIDRVNSNEQPILLKDISPVNIARLDNLPRHITDKILSLLNITDLISLGETNRRLSIFVAQYWKSYCDRFNLTGDPTPLCVGWALNELSLYSYDNAVALCTHPVKKWRLLAVRCFLRNGYRCVICRQHVKDRNSVDGFYFKHDVLLCYPQCYRIFTINFQIEMLQICKDYGISIDNLKLIDSTFPVLLVTQFIKTLRSMNIDEKEVLAKLRPYLGYSAEDVREYYEYTSTIKDTTDYFGIHH